MRKLRLLFTKDCNRDCPGCCNKDWDLDSLPVCTDFTPYDLVMITGGEPMLYPEQLLHLIRRIREENPKAKIILYTAWTGVINGDRERILKELDGITYTVHEQRDWCTFARIDSALSWWGMEHSKSLRLNVFKEANVPEPCFQDRRHGNWKIKRDIEWIPDCPLPEGEVFMRVSPEE